MMDWFWNIGIWESLVICLGFSIIVIAIDEWNHARKRRARESDGTAGH